MKPYSKYILLLLLVFLVLLVSFNDNTNKPLLIPKHSADLSMVQEVVLYKNKVFTGILFELHPNKKDTLLLQSFKYGLLDGVSKRWFLNRQLMEYRVYKSGRKHGKQIAFWDNGKKRFEFTAFNDAYEGTLKEWTIDGNLFHLAHYKNGQEEGSQKMWYENGKIRANYVIINGKRYGLLGTKNCRNVSDSIFVVK